MRVLGSGYHTEIINYPVIIALVSSLKFIDKMVDKTGTLNKKTKDSLNATWDVLKIQCSILIFAVVAVVALFFVMRIFPKQF